MADTSIDTGLRRTTNLVLLTNAAMAGLRNAKLLTVALSALCIATASTIAVAVHAVRKTSESSRYIGSLLPEQVQLRLAGGRIRVFDANPVDVFNKHHVRGARRVEYDQVKPSDLPADKSSSIVFYCMNERCTASPIAARRARELGWTDVYVMPAGIKGWIAAGLEVATADGTR